MSRKLMLDAKANFTNASQNLNVEGYDFVGFGTSGAIFYNEGANQYVVVSATAKKDGFDPDEEIAAQQEKEMKAAERAEERKAKALEKAEKEKAKLQAAQEAEDEKANAKQL